MSSITNSTGANVLGAKDANLPVAAATAEPNTKDSSVKSMEYHRQVLQSKMEAQQSGTNYISPSDEIMSPCTAKLNAFRNKQVGKVKPKSLFAQASSKRLRGSSEGLFGPKADSQPANKA